MLRHVEPVKASVLDLVPNRVRAVLVVGHVADHLVLLHVRVELLDERLRRPDGHGELIAREAAASREGWD